MLLEEGGGDLLIEETARIYHAQVPSSLDVVPVTLLCE